MATRKQKHLVALQRRAEFEEEVRRTGLEAQRKDRETRKAQDIRVKEDAMRINRRRKKSGQLSESESA